MRLYMKYFGIHMKSQMQYKVSFFMTSLGTFFISFTSLLGVYFNSYECKHDYIAVYIVKDACIQTTNDIEIEQSQSFDFTDLPQDISPGSKRRIAEYLQQKPISHDW